ncbi:MAG: hypothetical protein JWM85_2875 [Acidimicrobiaceae bacterium]|nr:hypothetical protein [Acidimicrobiaceae bacterium]
MSEQMAPAAAPERDGATYMTEAPQGRVPRVPAVVTLRPIASALPVGFFGLVVAATISGVQLLGILPQAASKAIGLLLLATVLVQVVGGIASIAGREVIAATLMLTFAGTWLVTALVFLVHPTDGLISLGIWYFALCPVIICLISAGTAKLALALVPMTGLPSFLLTAVYLVFGGKGVGQAAGVLTLALAVVALYAGLALLLEDARRRTVLPTLRRGKMRRAFTGDFADQLSDIEHEAGVREYL